MNPATVRASSTVEMFFNFVGIETLALFEHLSFEFLEEFDVFAPADVRAREWSCEFREVVLMCLVYNIKRYITP